MQVILQKVRCNHPFSLSIATKYYYNSQCIYLKISTWHERVAFLREACSQDNVPTHWTRLFTGRGADGCEHEEQYFTFYYSRFTSPSTGDYKSGHATVFPVMQCGRGQRDVRLEKSVDVIKSRYG